MFSQSTCRIVASLVVFLVMLATPTPVQAAADDRGSVGLYLFQLYDDQQPNHRGPLAVMHVVEDSPAAKADIHCSDFVVEVNGVPTPGREFSDILNKDIHGPIGGTVRLTVARFDGSRSDITLVRAPYPPHVNPASDPFGYVVPGRWGADSRYSFPVSWSPTLPYHGFVDLFFSPNFDDTNSPEYHSYLIFWSLEGTHLLSAEQLQSDMVTWYRGLAEERGKNYGFTPDLSKVTATYKEDLAASPTFGGAAARAFSGTVSIWDTHGKVIMLNSEVLISDCGTSNRTALFFGLSPEPRDGDMWKQLDAIRDTFQCRRP